MWLVLCVSRSVGYLCCSGATVHLHPVHLEIRLTRPHCIHNFITIIGEGDVQRSSCRLIMLVLYSTWFYLGCNLVPVAEYMGISWSDLSSLSSNVFGHPQLLLGGWVRQIKQQSFSASRFRGSKFRVRRSSSMVTYPAKTTKCTRAHMYRYIHKNYYYCCVHVTRAVIVKRSFAVLACNLPHIYGRLELPMSTHGMAIIHSHRCCCCSRWVYIVEQASCCCSPSLTHLITEPTDSRSLELSTLVNIIMSNLAPYTILEFTRRQ